MHSLVDFKTCSVIYNVQLYLYICSLLRLSTDIGWCIKSDGNSQSSSMNSDLYLEKNQFCSRPRFMHFTIACCLNRVYCSYEIIRFVYLCIYLHCIYMQCIVCLMYFSEGRTRVITQVGLEISWNCSMLAMHFRELLKIYLSVLLLNIACFISVCIYWRILGDCKIELI